jgi:hypothetical protein
MERSGAGNSHLLLPPFVELLSLDSSSDTSSLDNDTPSMLDRLTKLRSGFAAFKEEERSLTNFDYDVRLDALSLTITVHRDVEADEELIRSYGDEWIAMMYFHFQANWLKQRSNATAREDSDTFIVMFVAGPDGYIQDRVKWVKDGENLSDVAAEVSLILEKSTRAVPFKEMKDWASLMGMLGIEKFGKGNSMYDFLWTQNMTRLKTEQLGYN